jgi:hypothetical protein
MLQTKNFEAKLQHINPLTFLTFVVMLLLKMLTHLAVVVTYSITPLLLLIILVKALLLHKK